MTLPVPVPLPDPTDRRSSASRRRVASRAARVAAVLLGAVVVFQVAVALGAPWGAWTQGGGATGTLPPAGRAVAVVSALLLVVMALALLACAGEGPLARAPRRLVAVLAWATVAYLAVGVVANLATPSAQERALWAPVVALLLVLALVTLLTSRGAGREAGRGDGLSGGATTTGTAG